MTSAIEIKSDSNVNSYIVAPKECTAIMSRSQWNYKSQKETEFRCSPVSYWVIGYVNGVFTSLELYNYRDAKHLFLAMCKG